MINIQETMKELFGGSCYGYCLVRQFTGIEDIKTLTYLFLEGWRQGFIDNDGFVSQPLKFIEMICGEKYKDVTKPKIDSLEKLPSGNWIVEYKRNPETPASHFVVANGDDEKVIFDPSGNSNTVKVGKPFSYRKFIR